MCKSCAGKCVISGLATWAFFALVLDLLGVVNPGINGLFLTVLMSVAMVTCPIMNPKIPDKCTCVGKKKKKK